MLFERSMRVLLATAATLMMTASSGLALAEEAFVGTELLQLCSSQKQDDSTRCSTYIMGFTDGLAASRAMSATGMRHCFPPNLVISKVRTAVEKYLSDHPERLNLGAANLVAVAVSESFPCKKSR
jgi:hypothetical protein